MGDIHFEGRHERAEITAALRVLQRDARRQMAGWLVVTVLGFAFAVVLASWFVIVAIPALLGLGWRAAVRRRTIERLLAMEVRGVVADRYLEVQTATEAERVAWAGFTHRSVAERFVVLHRHRYVGTVLSRRFFASDSDWTAFLHRLSGLVPGAPDEEDRSASSDPPLSFDDGAWGGPAPGAIVFRGRYPEESIAAAVRLMTRRYWPYHLVTFVTLAALFLAATLPGAGRLTVLGFLVRAGFGVGVAGTLVAVSIWRQGRRGARSVIASPLGRSYVEGAADEEGFRLHSGLSSVRSRWSAFSRAQFGDENVVLYRQTRVATPVARGFFASDDDWSRFRELVRRQVVDRDQIAEAG